MAPTIQVVGLNLGYLAGGIALVETVEQGPVDQVLDHPEHEYTRHLLADLPSTEG